MSSLVSKSQQSSLDEETACLFLKLGIFSRNNPLFSGFFQQLKQLKVVSDVILFISQLRNSMREKIRELFGQIDIQISEEQLRILMESPTDTFNSFMIWRNYFTNSLNEEQRGIYHETYQNQFIPFEKLISFSKSLYLNEKFGIYVKNLTGLSIKIEITYQMSIEELKRKIQEEDGTPVEQQRFVFAGKDFKDSMLLGMYNIQKDSTINLVLRCRGGMHHTSSTGNIRNDYDLLSNELSQELQELFKKNFYE